MNNLTIKNDIQNQLFFTKIGSGHAYLTYEKPSQNVIKVNRTYVPPKYRELAVASKLTKYVLEYAKGKGLSLIPECDFVQNYLDKHPQYKELVKSSRK